MVISIVLGAVMEVLFLISWLHSKPSLPGISQSISAKSKGLPVFACASRAAIASSAEWTQLLVKFKEERLARLQASESPAASWLPEIDFIGLELTEVSKPVVIGNGDITSHAIASLICAAESIVSPLEVFGVGSEGLRTRNVNLLFM